MNLYVLTSDRYNFLLEGYSKLFNQHWDDHLIVTVLGFDPPKVDLPDNFRFHSMGKQKDYPTWSGPLIEYFSKCQDEYFFLCFEDHYLVNTVAKVLVEEIMRHLSGDRSIDKVYLMPDDSKIKSHYKGKFYESVDRPNALVTTSLLPAIWKKEFFMRLLSPSQKRPHDFEIQNNRKTLGCKVIMSRSIIYPSVDAVRKGNYNYSVFHQFEQAGSYKFGPYRQPMSPGSVEVFRDMAKKWERG